MAYPEHQGLVLVRWIDVKGDHDHILPAEVSPGMEMQTTGFLWRYDNEWLVIAGEICENETGRCVTSIPRSIVREVIPLSPLELLLPRLSNGSRKQSIVE